ncbi:FAD:protein FMN transferase [Peptostreptococcaceae bacterium AGR-M142]
MFRNKKNISLVLIISMVFFMFLFSACEKKDIKDIKISRNGFFLDTFIDISLYDTKDEKLLDGCFEILKDIENKMSRHDKDSEISKINNKAGKNYTKVSDDVYYVIKKSLEFSNLSNGNFDITIGKLASLWNIGNKDARLPSKDEIEEALKYVDYKDIKIKENSNMVKLDEENMIIDLGGIAKGYASDKIKNYLESKNIKRAIINLGGNICVIGEKSKELPWNIGIQNPFNTRGEYLGILKVKNKSVVTSGIYERYLEYKGKKYHHILSPFNGYPIQNELVSVSIISYDGIDCDALSTSLFALGKDNGLKLANKLTNIEAIFVTKDKKIYLTNNLKDKFILNDDDFDIVK